MCECSRGNPGRFSLADAASLHFLRDDEHRRELLAWMRLSAYHQNFHRDGLNARAMNLSRFGAWGAGLVLGSLFVPLDRLGFAAPIVNEASKARTAAAIALFHRPVGEDPFFPGAPFIEPG